MGCMLNGGHTPSGRRRGRGGGVEPAHRRPPAPVVHASQRPGGYPPPPPALPCAATRACALPQADPSGRSTPSAFWLLTLGKVRPAGQKPSRDSASNAAATPHWHTRSLPRAPAAHPRPAQPTGCHFELQAAYQQQPALGHAGVKRHVPLEGQAAGGRGRQEGWGLERAGRGCRWRSRRRRRRRRARRRQRTCGSSSGWASG